MAQELDWLGGTPKKPVSDISVGFLVPGGVGGNIYVVQYVDKLKELAKAWGVDLTILDAENDPAKQSQQMPDLIAAQPDAIIVWAANGKAIVPALIKQAHDAGIPVVTINRADRPGRQGFHRRPRRPERLLAGRAGRRERSSTQLGGKGNVVEIRGTIGFGPGTSAHQAFVDTAAKFPDVKLLDVQAGNWSQSARASRSTGRTSSPASARTSTACCSSDGYSGTGAYLAVQAGGIAAGPARRGHDQVRRPATSSPPTTT